MKRIHLLLFATLCLSLWTASAQEPKSPLSFINTPVQKILTMYQHFSGLELVQSSEVKKLSTTITLKTNGPVSKADLIKLMEQALLTQAGVVISHLDEHRASVTYNDALPIIPAGDGD
jgi:type II secretory pathway component GspD/PulD (secretin)